MSEAKVLSSVWRAFSKIGGRLFRNNVGVGWQGKIIREPGTYKINKGDIVIRHARRINFGLLEGSGDLIGWYPVEITSNMVGVTLPLFTSVEAKDKNKEPSPEQTIWYDGIKNINGLSVIAYNFEDIEKEIEKWKKKISCT